MLNKRLLSVLLALLLVTYPLLPVFSLPSDKDAPIKIQADSVSFNQKTGISHYQGNVRLTQGSIQVRADQITVEQNDSEVSQVRCIGEPVSFKQQPESNAPEMVAHAKEIIYRVTDERLWLSGEAKLWDGTTQFSSHQIEYDLLRSVILASKGRSAGGAQVEMTIAPRKQESSNQNQ